MKQYYNLVYTVVSGIIGRQYPQDIEECITDVFVSLWKSGHLEGDLKNLLITIARRRGIDKVRSMREPVLEELSEELPEFCNLDQEILDNLNRDIIRQTLENLPPPDGEIFVLRYYYCQSVKEIAAAIRRKPAYVRDRLHLAKSEIRKQLYAHGINL